MSQINLSIRVNEEDKKNFEMFCNETGMNISVAINMFIKNVIREHKLPFEIYDSFYSEKNIKALKKSINQIEKGEVVSKTIAELKKMEDA